MKLFIFISTLTIFIISPIMAISADITWTSENYRAYGYAGTYDTDPGTPLVSHSDEAFAPPFPANAHTGSGIGVPFAGPAEVDVNINSSRMSMWTYSAFLGGLSGLAQGMATFSGAFVATQPSFQFTYDYAGNINEMSDSAWLTIVDQTTGITIYDVSLTAFTSDTVSIPLLSGHIIGIDFGFSMSNVTEGVMRSSSLSYATAVVPEPISSILFMTGVGVLAVRRCFREAK